MSKHKPAVDAVIRVARLTKVAALKAKHDAEVALQQSIDDAAIAAALKQRNDALEAERLADLAEAYANRSPWQRVKDWFKS